MNIIRSEVANDNPAGPPPTITTSYKSALAAVAYDLRRNSNWGRAKHAFERNIEAVAAPCRRHRRLFILLLCGVRLLIAKLSISSGGVMLVGGRDDAQTTRGSLESTHFRHQQYMYCSLAFHLRKKHFLCGDRPFTVHQLG